MSSQALKLIEEIMKWQTLEKVSQNTGLSTESLRALKKRGVFREKIHWTKAPNGRIFLNTLEIENWIVGNSSRLTTHRG